MLAGAASKTSSFLIRRTINAVSIAATGTALKTTELLH